MKHTGLRVPVWDICLVGMMVAVIEVCKAVLSFLPNVELTTFWLIMFTLYLGKRVYFVIPVFILIEGAIYGFGLWWVMYLYTWPALVLVTAALKKTDSAVLWAVISGVFGLLFGLLCALPYIFVGWIGAELANGLRTAFAWWIAGIPWDLVHGVANFVIMLVLYHPISSVMKKLDRGLIKQ